MKYEFVKHKRLFFILRNVFLLIFTSSTHAQEYTDGIVAVVDDEIITAYDVATFSSETEKAIHRKYSSNQLVDFDAREKLLTEINSMRVEAANELINQKLIYAEFVKKGYQLPEGLVDSRMDSIVSTQAGGDWAKFEEMLIASNTTVEELRGKIEKNLIVDLFINQTIDKNINITPEQIEEYYQKNIDLYSEPRKIRLQVIGFSRKDNMGTAEPEPFVEKIMTQLNEGVNFSDLVRKYSTHPSKEKDGDLGWISESNMRQEFINALHKIRVNEFSHPIDIGDTTYILKISDIQNKKTQPLDELFDKIKNELFHKEKEERFEKFIDDLRSKSYVRVFFK